MSDAKQELERIKAELAAADDALAAALDARSRHVLALDALKRDHPEDYLTLPRDADMTARMAERVKDFPPASVRPVMREVLSACNRMVAPVEVVYVGNEGGFGHLAARKHFGSSTKMRGVERADDVLDEVARGQSTFGVLPFETSYDGAVTATLNLLARGDAKICAAIPVRRTFHLMTDGGSAQEVQTIFASASAITACQSYLQKRFPQATIIDTKDGLAAAERARQQPGAAALGTAVASEVSGLKVVERGIEDVQDLETRYVAVGNDYPPRTGSDRTAIALALHDAPGVLIDCLKPFAERSINLCRLETRPARGWEWRYLILFEADGHITDRPMLAAIEELRTSSRYVKVLGSYPSGQGG